MSAQEAVANFRNLFIGVSIPSSAGAPRFARPSIQADGSFRLGGLSPGKGHMTIDSFPRRNFKLLHVERDGVEQSEDFDIAAGENINGLRLIVGMGNCVIRGELKIANGTLPEGVQFVISAQRVGDSSPQNRYEANSDARGRFVLDGLMPGDYEISAGSEFFINGPVAAPVRFKEAVKTVSVTNENEVQITITLERETGNKQ
jgi:hypothetical protein